MRARKCVSALISAAVAVLFGFTLAACSDNVVPICAEHSFGEWTVTATANCKDRGSKERVCSVCKAVETMPIERDPETHYAYSDWTCDVEATCQDYGHEFRVCLNCGAEEERGMPKDPDKHFYYVWEHIKSPTCSEEGERRRECLYCGDVEEQKIPVDPTVHNFVEGNGTPSTCSTHGTSGACEWCGIPNDGDLPLDPHNHTAELVNGVCPDCHGMLEDTRILNNSTGKAVDSFGMTLAGNFKLEYDFYVKAGVEPQWDNFILDVRPAGYVDGKLTMTPPGLFAPDTGAIMFIPWPVDGNEHYGNWWKHANNSNDSTWFFDENGADLIYQDCVQKGVNVKMTVERVNYTVSVVAVMTVELNGKYYDCTVTGMLNYPGIEVLYVGLTAEDTNVSLRQVVFIDGTVAPPTKSETAEELSLDKTMYYNSGGGVKNADGFDLSFNGDFDIEYELSMYGDDANDWHSWILYMFEGGNDLTVGAGHKLYYSVVGNGNTPENYVPTYKQPYQVSGGRTYHWQCRTEVGGDFATKLQFGVIKLRVVRKNGYISVIGTGETLQGEVFVYYADFVGTYSGFITLRMTSEMSVFSVDVLRLYNGTPLTPSGACFLPHSFGEWQTATDATCTEAGVGKRVCSLCNTEETKEIAATGHSYGDWTTAVEGKVCKDGKETRTCAACGDVDERIVAATGSHTFGEWTTVKEPQCGTPGQKQHTCSVCGDVETDEIAPSGSHSFGEWEVVTAATCTTAGERKRECSLCDEVQTEEIAATGHSFSEWEVVTAATCTTAGERKRECSECDEVETEEITATGHSYGDWITTRAPSCSAEGQDSRECTICQAVETRNTLPISIYDHSSEFVNGVCPDCHGMLKAETVINNSAGKIIDSFGNVYAGDFEVQFEFKQHTGSNGTWHNFILVTGPATYIDGRLVRPIVDETQYVPWTMGDATAIGKHYGDFWKMEGNTSSTTWFKDENGNGGYVFDELMKLDPDIVITAKPDGKFLYVKVVMTVVKDGKTLTCTLESNHNMSGADSVYIGLSGESNTLDLKQAKLLKGSMMTATTVETYTDVIDSDVVINNDGAKNQKSLDVTLGAGDFDIEYMYEMAGDGVSDWHSWLLYFYKASANNTIYWAANGNGTEPDSPQVNHSMAHRFLRKLGNDAQFNVDLKNATVHLRVTRRNGYISIVGIGYKQGTTDPFVFWRFGTFTVQNNEQVRLHLTGESCSATVKSVKLYKGTLVDTALPA